MTPTIPSTQVFARQAANFPFACTALFLIAVCRFVSIVPSVVQCRRGRRGGVPFSPELSTGLNLHVADMADARRVSPGQNERSKLDFSRPKVDLNCLKVNANSTETRRELNCNQRKFEPGRTSRQARNLGAVNSSAVIRLFPRPASGIGNSIRLTWPLFDQPRFRCSIHPRMGDKSHD